MRTYLSYCLAVSAFLFSACSPTPDPNTVRSEVQPLVKKFADVTLKDISATLAMYSPVPEVNSVSNGTIYRGIEAIRASADASLGNQEDYKLEVGSIDVVPLGNDYALSVTPFSVKVTNRFGLAQQLQGASTLIWQRTGEGWRILHEHESFRPPQ